VKSLWLDEGKVRIGIIAFSLIGLAVLAAVSFTYGSEKVHISELSAHTGATVEVKGTVVGALHHRSGLTEALVHEGGDLLYLDIERSTREISPGDVISIRGEAFVWDESMRMSVSTDRTMDLDHGGDLPMFDSSTLGSVCFIQGVVVGIDDHGRYGFNLSLESLTPSGERFTIWAMVLKVDVLPAIGDGIDLTGLHSSEDGLICFGPDSIDTMYKGSPVDTTLLELIDSDPGSVPRDPLRLDCYLRYTPMGRSMYIGESPEGARISVKVVMPDTITGFYRGDLVSLINCSLEWDPMGMRYNVLPSDIELVDAHGIWSLSLGSLPYGIGDYEGCPVNVSGELSPGPEHLMLTDGNSTIEVRGGGIDDPAVGWITYDAINNLYYLDRERSL
jgi:hypothetical protein